MPPVAPAPADVVDLERYPLHALESTVGRPLVARCQEQLERDGACELPGFLRPRAAARMAAAAARLAPLAHRHAGASTPYLEAPDEAVQAGHPRRRTHPFSLGAVAFDHLPQDDELRRLYLWDGLLRFVAAALGEPVLHRYADPLGACNVAVMVDGDELEWHFDQTDFVVSIALQDADGGGDFLYAPRIRRPGDERYAAVAAVLDGDAREVHRVPMEPGTLLLFQGRWSMHCVTPVRGATPRLVALLSYDTKPGTCASPLLQQVRYGRVARPAAPADQEAACAGRSAT